MRIYDPAIDAWRISWSDPGRSVFRQQIGRPRGQDIVQEGFTVEKKGRIVRPNTKPGLGITINEAEVKKHPFQQELLQRVFYKDGSIGDW